MKLFVPFAFVLTLSMCAQAIDHVKVLGEHIRKLNSQTPPRVTYETNSGSVFCRISWDIIAGDISQFAGQVGELRITAPVLYPNNPHQLNAFIMDDIRFSASPL